MEFPSKGLVLLLGNNLASDGHLDSLGAGKTNFGTALSRAVVGIPDKLMSKFSRHKGGDTYVKVEGTLHEEPFIIETGYKCAELSKTGEGLRFQVGSQAPISRSHINLTKEELTRVIGVAPELSRWAVFVNGDKIRFDELSQREAVELLMVALHQPRWSAVSKKSHKARETFNEEVALNETRLRDSRQTVAECETSIQELTQKVNDATAAYDKAVQETDDRIRLADKALNVARSALENIQTKQKGVANEIEQITKQKAERYAELERSRLDHDSRLKIARDPIKGLVQDYTRKQDARVAAERGLKRPGHCPTCGQVWTMDEEHKAHLEEAIENARRVEDESKERLDQAQHAENSIQVGLDQVNEDLRQLNVKSSTTALSKDHQRLTREADQWVKAVHQAELELERESKGPDRSSVVAAQTELKAKQDQWSEAAAQVTKFEHDIADGRSAVNVLNYWVDAFDPKGITNMILREAVSPLNSIARRVSQVMVGGMIEVKFDTSHELQSGEERDELVVNVRAVEGSGDLDMTSKGESCIANLVISEALSEIGQVHGLVNFAWFDEVTKNFPAHVRSVFFHYLKEKADRLNQLIFVVDHSPEAANFADYVLLAEKTSSNGTTLKWIDR